MAKPQLRLWIAVFALPLLALPATVIAVELEPLDTFSAATGIYQARNDVEIRSDRGTVRGTDIHFRRDLGFDDDHRARVWQVAATLWDDHQIKGFGYRFDGNATRTLATDLVIGDVEFPVDGSFRGNIDIDVDGASYTWFLHRDQRNAFGIGLGALRYGVKSNLAATIEVVNETLDLSTRIREQVWAPLVRAEYIQVLHRNWRLHLDVAAVRKPSGSVSGNAFDLGLGLDWFPFEHFGLRAGYRYNDVDLELDKSSYAGEIRVRHRGPQVLAMLRF